MGNTNKNFKMKEFKQIKRQSNTLLGTISHVQIPKQLNTNPQQKELYIMKVLHFTDKLVFEERCLIYNRIKCLNKSGRIQNLLNVVQTHQSGQSSLCSENFALYVFMDHYESDLESMCIQKNIKNLTFSESQIIQIIKAVVNGLISIDRNQLIPPFLSKKCIVFTQKNGVKLIPSNLIDSIHPYQYFYHGENMRANFPYLSPQVFRNLKNGIPKPEQISTKKANIFTLGMIALELAIKNDQLFKIYNFNTFRVEFQEIQRYIQSLSFSKGFKQLLRGMLEQKQTLRYNLQNVCEIVNKPRNKLYVTQTQKRRSVRNDDSIPNIMAKSYVPTVYLKIDKDIYPSEKHKPEVDKQQQIQTIRLKNSSFQQIRRNPSISYFGEYSNQNRTKDSKVRITLESKIDKPEKRLSKRVQLGSRRCLVQISSKKQLTNFQFEASQDRIDQSPQTQISKRKAGGIKSNLIIKKTNNISIQEKQYITNGKRRSGKITKNLGVKKKHFEQQNVNISLTQNNLTFQVQRNNKKVYQNQSFIDESTNITFSENINKSQVSKSLPFKQLGKPSSKRKSLKKMNSEKQNFQPLSARKQVNSGKLVAQNSHANELQFFTAPLAERSQNKVGTQTGQRNQNCKIFTKKFFPSGARYQGQIQFITVKKNNIEQVEEIFSGKGTLYYPSNKVCYRGQWINNKFNGFGVLYNQNACIDISLPMLDYENFSNNEKSCWIEYEGQFLDDMKNGYGVLKFKNGEKYEGRFNKDRIEGVGVFFSKENQLIRGYWKNNKLLKQQ